MLHWRVPLGILIVAALVGVCWLDHLSPLPGAVLVPIALLFVLPASVELVGLMEASGLRPSRPAVYIGNVLVLTAAWALQLYPYFSRAPLPGWRGGSGFRPPADPGVHYTVHYFVEPGFWTMLALAAAVLIVLVAHMRRYDKPGKATADAAAAVFGIVYVGLLMSFAVELRMVWGIGALASLLIVVKMGDTGAYTIGRLVGRTRLAPSLSPGKTVEGAIGGILFACAGSWATFRWLVPAIGPHDPAPARWAWWGWIAFGLLVGLAGMAGDLAESLIKRDVGRKDSGGLLPGFGGVLDLVDSVLLAAPVAYACWALGLVGK